jgi:hypothetical protein
LCKDFLSVIIAHQQYDIHMRHVVIQDYVRPPAPQDEGILTPAEIKDLVRVTSSITVIENKSTCVGIGIGLASQDSE